VGRICAALRSSARLVPPQIILPAGIGIASFLIDLKTPDDIADGFIYLLAVLSCVWVPYPSSALFTALGLMFPMLLGFLASPSSSSHWTGITNHVLGVIVMWLVALIVWRSARLIREREDTLVQLERLHDSTERAANAERIELSRWLHDGLAQQLVALGWSLDRIVRHASDVVKTQAEARELRGVIDDALRTVHRKAVELRMWDNEHDGLVVLVERQVADFIGRTGLPVELSGTKSLERVSENHKLVCLKVLQEALTNAAKHASASRILVEIREEPRAILISIADDGRGIDMDARGNPDRLGLLGLHERLAAIGGSLTVSNATPHGARIDARVPIE
jgi:signal transduction histidine kinase